MILLCSFTGMPKDPRSEEGRTLYTQHCVRCHGTDGAKGKWGAHDLRYSNMNTAEIARQVRNGRGFMPSFNEKIAEQDVARIALYVRTLRIK